MRFHWMKWRRFRSKAPSHRRNCVSFLGAVEPEAKRTALDAPACIRLINSLMVNTRFALIVIGVLLIAQAGTPPHCLGDEVKCSGKYKGRLTPLSDDELAEILKQHDAWVKEGGPVHLDDPKVANDPRRANLCGADLTGAHLTGADLTGANLIDADLANTYLDFDSDTLPKVSPGIASAQNLQLVRFHDEPAALVKLRKNFKDLGLRTQENQLTYAIRRSELNRKKGTQGAPYAHTWSERVFNTVLFDWTCQYGMSPGRPLLIVAALAVILSIVYIFAQVNPGQNGGIWAVWDEHRIKQPEGSKERKEPQQLTDGFPDGRLEISFYLLALYFSLLSASRIGWHELNVGTWITRIQPREYSLRATGWVRVVSGI
jgi:hypothetical protein